MQSGFSPSKCIPPKTPGRSDLQVHGSSQQMRAPSGEETEREKLKSNLRPESDNARNCYALGTSLLKAERLADALHCFERSTILNPNFAEGHIALAIVLQRLERLNEAQVHYRRALSLRPDHAQTHFNLDHILLRNQKPGEAAAHSSRAVTLQPDSARAYLMLGVICQQDSRLGEAAAYYRKAIELDHQAAEAYNNLGLVLNQLGDAKRAESCYRKALETRIAYAEPCYNLALIQIARGEYRVAIDWLRRAIERNPDLMQAWNELGTTLKKTGSVKEAIRCYRQVVRITPKLAQGHYNLGSAFKQIEHFAEAEVALKEAIRLKPDYAQAHNNLGLNYKAQGHYRRALACFDRATAFQPTLPEAHWNRSFLLLMKGDFAQGWHEHEWRFKLPNWPTIYPHRLNGRCWNGNPAPGKTILVHDEQGLGDSIQFARFLPLVKQHCSRLIFETRRTLLPIFKGLDFIDQFVIRSDKEPPNIVFDYYLPLLSIPALFNLSPEAAPLKIPYLSAGKTAVDCWRKCMPAGGIRVGLVWAGRPKHGNDHNRSISLKLLAPLAEIDSVHLFGLQKGRNFTAADMAGSVKHLVNYGDQFADFSDTAGFIANLDLVISVDTAVAHLAGAMGKPVWTLIPFVPDWRWMLDREDTPWYPSMRLFRQPRRGDWNSVIDRVAGELERFANSKRSIIEANALCHHGSHNQQAMG